MNNLTAKEFRNRLNEFGKWRFMLYPAIFLFALAIVLTDFFHAVFRPIKYIEEKFKMAELYQRIDDMSHELKAYKNVFDNTYGKLWEDDNEHQKATH